MEYNITVQMNEQEFYEYMIWRNKLSESAEIFGIGFHYSRMVLLKRDEVIQRVLESEKRIQESFKRAKDDLHAERRMREEADKEIARLHTELHKKKFNFFTWLFDCF